MNLDIDKTSAVRHCHACSVTIPKGSVVWIEHGHEGPYPRRWTYCPLCSLARTKEEIRLWRLLERKIKRALAGKKVRA
jgi:hypothetical protein